jgi:hypothetical protein
MATASEPGPPLIRLLAAAHGLVGVRQDEHFGEPALMFGDVPFAIATRDGRIGVRLPDVGLHTALRTRGATPWVTIDGTMTDWVILSAPTTTHSSELATLVAAAHGMAGGPPDRPSAVSRVRPRGHHQTTSNETPSAKRRLQGDTVVSGQSPRTTRGRPR